MPSITQDIKYSLLTSTYPFVIIDTIYIKVREDHRVVSKALKGIFPIAIWQRCQVHMLRNILDKTHKKHMNRVVLS